MTLDETIREAILANLQLQASHQDGTLRGYKIEMYGAPEPRVVMVEAHGRIDLMELSAAIEEAVKGAGNG